ncbi:DUF6603 domain-containing protein [Kitasatospora sp. NPDC059812]|uniref:DUF6603 domain-containing protein n=1 Tax=Kitasatospora sp. NPDC059812 TaxID=3346958 RepID=UPI0036505098
MTLSIDELRQRLASSQGKTFEITGEELGAADLVSRHLGDSLKVGKATTDSDALTVHGTAALGAATGLPVTVAFTADADGKQLVGFDIAFTLSLWTFTTAAATEDFTYLSTFGFTQPRFVLRGGDVGAVLGCTLNGAAYRLPVDGDGPLVPDGAGGGELPDVTQSFGCALPADLGFNLTDVWLRYDQGTKTLVLSGSAALSGGAPASSVAWALLIQDRGDAGRRYLGVVQAAVKLSLSGLPIIKALVPPANDLVMQHVALLFITDGLDDTEVADLNKALKAVKADFPVGNVPELPAGPLDSGVTASLAYDLGGTPREAVKVRLGEASRTWTALPQDKGPSGKADQPAKAESSGPFRLGKLNLGYAKGTIQVTADFSINAHALTFEASGFGVSIPLADPGKATPVLKGLGISAKADPIALGGALRTNPTPDWPVRYDGDGMLTAPVISVGIAGSYARKADGTLSLFLFGQLGTGTNPEAGFGPPPFRVKDVSLGFGYHSEVRVPALTEVDTFPLLNLTGGADSTPMKVLDTLTGGLKPWVAPKDGEIWVAAGLHWTMFELADFRSMALVEFGESLVIALLGLGEFDFPKLTAAEQKAGKDPKVARIQIAAEALYRQSEGLLSLTAQLTDKSYILDKNCKPTGGLALCVWVPPSPHAGDFVVSVGGYHPAFVKPGHYPAVPRLGIKWSISNTLTLTAQAYAAITPHAAMLGGALALVFDTGPLRAWFTAHLDALIQWSPFFFDVAMGVSIGVRFSLHVWFVHITISLELGVDVELWGPPIGGNATVHLWFISFHIGFGKSRPDHLPPVPWTDFQSQLPPKQQAVQANPVAGLSWKPTAPSSLARVGDDGTDTGPWYASTHGFSFVTSSAVPASKVLFGGAAVTPDEDPLHIRPMQQGDLTSTHSVTITKDGQEVDHSTWSVEPVRSNVPQSLWGPGESSLNGTGLLPGRLTGLTVTVPAPAFNGQLTVAPGVLDLDPLLPQGALPLDAGAAAVGPVAQTSAQTVAAITSADTGIAAPSTATKREALRAQLGGLGYLLDPACPLSGYADLARGDLAAEPLLVPTGK